LKRELPLMAAIELRIEIERALRDYAAARGLDATRSTSTSSMLNELHQRRLAPPSTKLFLQSLRAMSVASHGVEVEIESVKRAIEVGTLFLRELEKLRTDN
jgi:hypothetical protein